MDIDPLELVAGCDEKEGYLSIFTTVLVFFPHFQAFEENGGKPVFTSCQSLKASLFTSHQL
jgi:hypothetical protein